MPYLTKDDRTTEQFFRGEKGESMLSSLSYIVQSNLRVPQQQAIDALLIFVAQDTHAEHRTFL
jgi:hypothetical protein